MNAFVDILLSLLAFVNPWMLCWLVGWLVGCNNVIGYCGVLKAEDEGKIDFP